MSPGASGDGALAVRVLGPLEVVGDGGPVLIRDGMPRRLLAVLLMRVGSPTTADALIDALWPEQPPNDPRNALQVLVSYLRRQFEPLAPGLAIVRQSGGYQLHVDDPLVIDAIRFEHEVRAVPGLTEGRSVEDLGADARRLEEALALWRGAPYVDATYEDFAQGDIARIVGLRAQATERLADLLLAIGRAGDASTILQRQVMEHPTRESSWASLIVALYRTGRQADALRAYSTARDHLVEELGVEPGPELRDLEQRVLAQDQSLHWAAPPGTAAPDAATPPLTGPGPVESRLPQPVSSLVGRVFEIEEVQVLVRDRRLVTLVGPAGVGKTRLAVEVAHALTTDHSVLFIELGALSDPSDLAPWLASEVGVPAVPGEDSLDAVAIRCGNHATVVVLDTCEHLLDAVAAAAAQLLRRTPNLRVLATSRQALGIEGEVAWTVPALELADDGARSLIDVEPSGAVRLFAERARAVRPDFALSEDNAADVARICRVLDGLPLAISLAAARVNVLSPHRIVERLDDRFSLLSRGGRDAERRQQSLRSAVEWSYELLGVEEQRLFCRLGVFTDSFDLDAATAVAGAGLDADLLLDRLGDLVDRSLVVARSDDRFVLLDTLRAFAADALARGEHGEDADALAARHAEWYTALAVEADPKGHGPLPGRAARLRPEAANLQAALAWSFSNGREAEGARLAGAAAGFLILDGRLVEAERWLSSARTADADDAVMATVERGTGVLALYESRFPEALAAGTRALERARRTGDAELIASMLLTVASAAWGLGDHASSIAHHREAAELFEASSDKRGLGFALARLGRTLTSMGDPEGLPLLERSEALLADTNAEWLHAAALEHLAVALLLAGRPDEALARSRTALSIAENVGSHAGELAALLTMGRVLAHTGDADDARRVHVAALTRAVGMGNPGGTADALDALADGTRREDPGLGAELLGCSDAVRARRQVSMVPAAAAAREDLVEACRAALGVDAYEERARAGRSRTPEWAIGAFERA